MSHLSYRGPMAAEGNTFVSRLRVLAVNWFCDGPLH